MSAALLGVMLVSCGSWEFKRVPPGQSLNVAMARKAEPLFPIPSSPRRAPAHKWWDKPLDPRNLPHIEEPELPVQSSSEDANRNYYARGSDYLQSGKVQEAIEAFQKAVKTDPSFAEAHYNLAVAYQQSGDEKKSVEEFKKYKSLLDTASLGAR